MEYTDHARRRMDQRGISEGDVEAALRRPIGAPQPGNRPDTVEVRGYAPGGRILKIILDAADNETVVSAMVVGRRDP